MAKVLVIDDEKIIRERMKKLLDLDDYETFTAEDGQKGLEIFHKEKPEIAKVNFRANTKWVNGGHNHTTINEFYGAQEVHPHEEPFERKWEIVYDK